MDEADPHPSRDEAGLAGDHAVEEGAIGVGGPGGLRVVPRHRVVGQASHRLRVAPGGEELERADPDVARRHPVEHRAGQVRVPHHGFPGRQGREGAGGRDAERRHGLADEIFAQHGTQCGPAVAAAGEGRGARAFQLDIPARSVPADDFAEQDRPAVAELRVEAAELVAGIGGGDGFRPFGQTLAGQDLDALGSLERVGVQPEFGREGPVQRDQARGAGARGHHAGVKRCGEAGVGIVEADVDRHGSSFLSP